MTNLSKNGVGQTALNLDDDTFDRDAYRDQLIAMGLPAEDAATVAAKTVHVRREALTESKHRATLIDAGMGVEQAKRAAAAVTRFNRTPEAFAEPTEPARVGGFQSVGALMGKSVPAAKKATAAPKAQPKEPAIIQRTAKPGAIITPQQNKLLDVGAQIAATTQEEYGEFMSFTHAVLCQVGLPRSKTAAREFMRKSGDAWVNVQAGWLDEGKGPVQQPIPYGAMPRLALAWVSSYAKRYSTREIPIGDSAADFLRLMGYDRQGGRYSTLRPQMHALAACRLQLGFKGRTFNGQPVEQFDAWVADGKAGQRSLWPGVMKLSEGYFNSLMDSAVPLDNRALHALKGSALALDVYAWLAHRLHRIEGRPVILHWKSLREQFAQEYTGKDPDKDFKDAFLPQLRNVLAVYPQAKVKQVTGGLMLMGSPPPIPKKS